MTSIEKSEHITCPFCKRMFDNERDHSLHKRYYHRLDCDIVDSISSARSSNNDNSSITNDNEKEQSGVGVRVAEDFVDGRRRRRQALNKQDELSAFDDTMVIDVNPLNILNNNDISKDIDTEVISSRLRRRSSRQRGGDVTVSDNELVVYPLNLTKSSSMSKGGPTAQSQKSKRKTKFSTKGRGRKCSGKRRRHSSPLNISFHGKRKRVESECEDMEVIEPCSSGRKSNNKRNRNSSIKVNFQCEYCFQAFYLKSGLMRHVRTKHKDMLIRVKDEPDDDAFVCDHCNYSVDTKSGLRKHILSVHMESKRTSQQMVRRRSSSKGASSSSGKQKSDELHYCFYCMRSLKRKCDMLIHVRTIHVERGDFLILEHKGYNCDVCGEGFPTTTGMLSHRKHRHFSSGEIDWNAYSSCVELVSFCAECKKYFKRGVCYDQHPCDKGIPKEEGILASDSKDFFCNVCGLRYAFKWDLRCHREENHPDAVAVDWDNPVTVTNPKGICETCDRAFADEITLDTHTCNMERNKEDDHILLRRSNEMDIMVKQQVSKFCSKRELIEPVLRGVPCSYCDKSFDTRLTLITHLKVEHDIETETPFVCKICNQLFKEKYVYDKHNKKYHPNDDEEETKQIMETARIIYINGEQFFHCDRCNKKFESQIRYVGHYRSHIVSQNYVCEHCGAQLSSRGRLNIHIKGVHLKIRDKICDICGKGFSSMQLVQEHRRIHTGERPFSCEQCGKTFIAMNALTTHKKAHNDYFPHTCSICPKKFKTKFKLIVHMRSHTGEKPYKCDLCSKSYTEKYKLTYHRNVTHSDLRPVSCNQCGSTFKSNRFLSRHMKLHSIRTHIQQKKRNSANYFNNSTGDNKDVTARTSQRQLQPQPPIVVKRATPNESPHERPTPQLYQGPNTKEMEQKFLQPNCSYDIMHEYNIAPQMPTLGYQNPVYCPTGNTSNPEANGGLIHSNMNPTANRYECFSQLFHL